MKSLSGVMLNINAEKAFVIFPSASSLQKSARLPLGLMSGKSEKSMSKKCQAYADGKITRKDLVSSLSSYLAGE